VNRKGRFGRTSAPQPGDPALPHLPSRDELMAYIQGNGGADPAAKRPLRLGKREIARAFGLKGKTRIALKRMLKDLESEGAITLKRRTLVKTGHMPAVVAVEIFARDNDGDLLARPLEWDEDHDGDLPKILILPSSRARPALHTPGIGERALARIEPIGDATARGPAYQGRLIKLLPRAKAQILGIFRHHEGAGGRIIPVDKKNMSRELLVPEGAQNGAKDGDLVSVELARLDHGRSAARVKERLGSLSSERAISLIAIHSHMIPHEFSAAALGSAERAHASQTPEREDWRHLPFVTIDPADARDHDDAVHAESDPNNPGGHILHVAIADVAAFVPPGSALDEEALERGNSVYFPDRVVPMLPERISNDLCSLLPDRDRPALAVRLVIAADGRKTGHSFHRVTIRSRARLSYPQAQAMVEAEGVSPEAEGTAVLRRLWAAYACLKTARERRGPLDLDLPERKLILRADGTLDRVIIPVRLEAHRLIEELMILANVAAAETLEACHQPLIYRAHDEPTIEKLKALSEFLASINIKLNPAKPPRPRDFNAILAAVSGAAHENLVNEVVLRAQSQAEYTAENYGHFGLNLRRYAHFTSPIRRYADLVVHRALITGLRLGGESTGQATASLDEIAARISAAERRAMAAERETVDRLIASHLSERIGASFSGRIAGVTRAGLFVKLADTGADGFVPAASLGDDYFRYDEALHALIGTRTRLMHRLGDSVEVRLVEAAPFAGALRFELIENGEAHRGSAARGLRVALSGRKTKSKNAHKDKGARKRQAAARPGSKR
jgi:ribonuclease R